MQGQSDMANNSTLVLHKGYDWGLSYGQKLFCAWICTACSLIPLLGYSTPNTMYVAHLIGRNIFLQLFGITISGSFVLQSVAICINAAEVAFIHLIIWKGGLLHWAGLIITMTVSVSGSFIFHDQAQDAVLMKKGEIKSHRDIGSTYQDLSKQQDEEVNARKEQIRSLNLQESNYQQQVYRGEIPKIPDWVSARKRQAAEEISLALKNKATYADSLKKYTFSGIEKEAQAGYLVDFGPEAKNISIGVSIFIEIFLVFFGFLAVILWDSAVQDTDKGKAKKTKIKRNEIDLLEADEIAEEDSASQVVVLKNKKSDTGRPIGFAINHDQGTNIKVKVNSAEAICLIIDHYDGINEPMTNSKIAEMVGCSDTWVATVRKKYRSN